MIRLALIVAPFPPRPARLAASILCGTVMSVASASEAATPRGTSSAPAITSPVPLNSTDHYVAGKYDKTGTYIPPHYQPVAKPPFHGYFFKKDKAGIDVNPNQSQNQKPN